MNMYYETEGKGGNLIFLHGGLVSSSQWQSMIQGFADQFCVYSLDSRGHGKSDNPSENLNYRMMADDVVAFVKEMKLETPLVVGWSDGGQIALELGMHNSELFSGLVIGAAWHSLADELIAFVKSFGFMAPGEVNHEQMCQVLESAGVLDSFVESHSGGLEQLYAVADALSVPWLTDLNYQTDDFARITIPILILQGDRDAAIPLAQAVHMYDAIDRAELAVIPNAGHSLPLTHPEQFIATVRDFASRHMAS